MAEQCGIANKGLLDEIEAAGWTHDLGKATKGMQDVLSGRKKADEDFDGPLHHLARRGTALRDLSPLGKYYNCRNALTVNSQR